MSPNTLKTLSNTAKAAFFSCLAAATLNATGNPADWALKKRTLRQGESPISQYGPVKYTFDYAPWCEELCREFVNPENTHIVAMMGSNMGKTSGFFFNCLGWIIDESPRDCMWALKTQDQMDGISKKQINPFLENNPALAGKIAPPKSRDSSNTISLKLFHGGSLAMIGTESITGLRANRTPSVFLDEIDSWTDEVGDEGGPVPLVLRRSDGFPNATRVLASTPGTKGASRIEEWFLNGDQRKWFVPCQCCRKEQLILWKDIVWPKGETKMARWKCSYCGHEHDDKGRRKAVIEGKWKATAKFNGIRSYWINGLNSLFPPNPGYENKLHQWAEEVTAASHAMASEKDKKTIVQTLFCETWVDKEDAKPDWEVFSRRREDYTPASVPIGVIKATGGVDVQLDRLECTVLGHGRNGETWVIVHIIKPGDPSRQDFDNPNNVWNQMEADLVGLNLTRTDKKRVPISGVGVDTSEPKTKRTAWEFIRPRQFGAIKWFGLRGSSLVDAPEVLLPKRSKVDRITLRMVGTNLIKGQIYERAMIETPGTRYIHIGREITQQWCEQLFSETSRPVWKNQVRYRQFECPKNTRNEALDCFVYGTAALITLMIRDWDYEEKNLKTEDQPTVQQEKAQTIAHSVGGFVGGGGGWRI